MISYNTILNWFSLILWMLSDFYQIQKNYFKLFLNDLLAYKIIFRHKILNKILKFNFFLNLKNSRMYYL
jgi:hypothetical protein